ncbi:non-homologous end joining protein Ku [Rugamonas apoptosis]|uniref:Non-homologous end joining protein Ku n=1 Tax=Rugamonas apoptosis TaxID=2758570 RepID=A0A7W2FF32_9BURK|nr:Ku protein [Rugamonas apoptosis]MBA5690518.1 Ku protein [Rugamonas apoptosis]
MARALWKGAISFGLVHIPVELHTAVRPDELNLTMLDRRDFSPVGYRRYNKRTGEEVTWDDIVKGYGYEDDEYVVLTDEDLRRANVAATQTIEILSFAAAEEIPLTYYEQAYYLTPVRSGARVYALLRETLRKSGKVGVATVVIRTRQHLCALVCLDDAIVLNTLRYATEILDTDGLDLPPVRAADLKPKELAMAMELVDGMAEPWRPQQYRDSYRDDLLALIEKKVKAGKTHVITKPGRTEREPGSSNVVDLVELLQRSLRGQGGRAGKRGKNAETRDGEASEEASEEASPRRSARTGKTTTRDQTNTPSKSSGARKTAATHKSSGTSSARRA